MNKREYLHVEIKEEARILSERLRCLRETFKESVYSEELQNYYRDCSSQERDALLTELYDVADCLNVQIDTYDGLSVWVPSY